MTPWPKYMSDDMNSHLSVETASDLDHKQDFPEKLKSWKGRQAQEQVH